LLHIQESGHAGQQALAEGGVAGDNVGEFALLDVLNEERRIVFGKALQVKKKSGTLAIAS
jgi:hypothetical protein